MNNKSNFLNLPSDLPGDARRHVPFRSIIHKPLCLIFVLSFVFSILFSYVHPVAALADPQPEYDPVYNTEIIRLTDYVDNELTPDQQDIFYISFGAYLVAQGAMQDFLIDDPYTTQDGIIGWFKSLGIQFYNSAIVQNALMSPSLLVQQGIQDLVDIGMGLAIKAGLYQDKVTFINDIMSSDHYFFPFNRGLQIGINNVLAQNGGLYDWSIGSSGYVPPVFDYNYTELSGVSQTDYLSKLSTVLYPRVFCKSSNANLYNIVSSRPDFKYDLFINTLNHTIDFTDSILYSADTVVARNNSGTFYSDIRSVDFSNSAYTFSSAVSSYKDALDDYFNYSEGISGTFSGNFNGITVNRVKLIPNLFDFVDKILIGPNLASAVEFSVDYDFNFHDNNMMYYLQVQTDYLLDLKGIIQDLIDVVQLKPVIYDNIYDPSGNQVTPITNQVAVTVSLPDSGISIPTNLFSPLTKQGGYISYLWYMTKPLVQYTSDFVQTLVFPDDTGEGFDVTGPGAIVFGVISLGLIGGLVVKCLL